MTMKAGREKRLEKWSLAKMLKLALRMMAKGKLRVWQGNRKMMIQMMIRSRRKREKGPRRARGPLRG
jgi:hypothetical protein